MFLKHDDMMPILLTFMVNLIIETAMDELTIIIEQIRKS